MSTYTLAFGRSISPHYAQAVQLAASFPGYVRTDDGAILHRVPLTGQPLGATLTLLRLVNGWKSTFLEIDGSVWAGVRPSHILAVLDCHDAHEASGISVTYCWTVPTGRPRRLPCQFVERALPYYPQERHHDAELLRGLLSSTARTTAAEICPAYVAGAVFDAALKWAGSAEEIIEAEVMGYGDRPIGSGLRRAEDGNV